MFRSGVSRIAVSTLLLAGALSVESCTDAGNVSAPSGEDIATAVEQLGPAFTLQTAPGVVVNIQQMEAQLTRLTRSVARALGRNATLRGRVRSAVSDSKFAEGKLEFRGLIDDANFGVNYDPSNAILAGEEPLELLARVKHRVVTMHASDRYLAEGTIDDLRREEDSQGYAARLSHGEIGQGLNDYDAIFRELNGAGFNGWISIEDGVDGMDQLARSVTFLREKISQHWG